MSATTPIEQTARVTASFVRYLGTTKDADGNVVPASTVLQAGVVGDLQPNAGRIIETAAKPEPASTHTFYPLARLTASLKQGDVCVLPDGTEYRVVFVHDFRGAHQEIDVEQVEGDE